MSKKLFIPGPIDVKEEVIIYIPFHFIISSKDDVN